MDTFKGNYDLFVMGHTDWYIYNFCTKPAVQLMLTNLEHRYTSLLWLLPRVSTSRNIPLVNISVAFYSNKHYTNTIICPLAMTQSRIPPDCLLHISQLLPLNLPFGVGAGD